jgi:hypothetical protein
MFLTRLTSSPHLYTFLYIAICMLAAFNIFEVLFLLVHKRRVEKAEAKKELLKHRITTAVITVTDPSELLPAPKDSTDHEAYSEAVASIIGSFQGEVAERAIQLIYKLKIDRYYQRLCKNPVWYKRAHAVDILSALKLTRNRDFFPDLFKTETSNDVKYRIIYGLSLLARDQEYIYSLCKLLSGLPYLTAKYTEDVFFNAITALKGAGREAEFKFFLKRIMAAPEILTIVKRDCLSACHAAGCEQMDLIVMEYYWTFQDEPEVMIACIKSLVSMGDLAILPSVLRHKDWRVRLTALKSAHLCGPEVLPALKDSLHDTNYHLRINAALALARFGAEGRAILRGEAASPDKFAADAARYALGSAEAAA